MDVAFTSTDDGLQINAEYKPRIPDVSDAPHPSHKRALEHFHETFIRSIDTDILLADLKQNLKIWEGGCRLGTYNLRGAHPIFSSQGDFFFELHGPQK